MTLNAIVTDINAILSKHGVSDAMQLRDITVTDKTVSDMAKPSPRLSDAITAHLWPSISSATVYHYTSREAAENILSTGIFRLCQFSPQWSHFVSGVREPLNFRRNGASVFSA